MLPTVIGAPDRAVNKFSLMEYYFVAAVNRVFLLVKVISQHA